MKVRYDTRCAGWCRLVLRPGSRAHRAHRGLWCPACYVRHRERCGACQEAGQLRPADPTPLSR